MEMLIDNFSHRIDGLLNDVQSLKDSLQFSQREIDDLKSDSSKNRLV